MKTYIKPQISTEVFETESLMDAISGVAGTSSSDTELDGNKTTDETLGKDHDFDLWDDVD